ncbi:Rrf2 family transcriptional regulator [Asanoa sp. WMMD1127]|uniref:RrF2 family transcriptional regulator n=1 Tax=Asanoa sp. WMMD1127 TaxID=3016107 RepID=UPI002416F45F|nr:Rrf2 family transcriptional regulator [Asanoa sp. WMMD1127]MDG4827285.1 Rrf2 family transcriptional regulator [Asanoa sp. WMMD1127]
MQVSARTDYALRAMLAVADAPGLVTAAALARAQQMPPAFLQSILGDLRRAELLHGRRGGGYTLTRPAAEITVGDVVRAVNGALTTVRGLPTETAAYPPAAAALRDVWLAVHDRIADVVDRTTLADLLRPVPSRGPAGAAGTHPPGRPPRGAASPTG